MALEGSDDAKAQVPLVAAIAAACGTEVIVAHVHVTPLAAAMVGEHEAERSGIESRAAAKRLVAQAEAALAAENVRARGVVLAREQTVGRQIVDLALDEQAGLIAVGPHTGEGWSSRILGSTAQEVIRRAHCPVLIVPRDAPPRQIRRLLLVADATAAGRRALLAVCALARRLRTSLTVVAIHEGLYVTAGEPETLADVYAAAARGLGVRDVDRRAFSTLAAGTPQAVGETTSEVAADLVAIGAHDSSALERILLGTQTEQVVAASRRPVLVVR